MTRVIIVNDVHLADRPPSIRTETYTDDIFAKLEWVFEYAREQKVPYIVFSGDVFHVKTPSRTSHALVQRLCSLVQRFQTTNEYIGVFAVPGNHDISHDRLDSLDRQPLGTLFKAGVQLLDGEARYSVENFMFGIPWLQDWDAEPGGSLMSYMSAWQQSSAELMVTHAPIVPSGQTRPYFTIDASDWAGMMGRGGSVAYGHMHDPDGVYFIIGGVVGKDHQWEFANEGALSRGSIHESTLQRRPAVTLWESGKGFTRIEVPHKPAEEVFRLVEHQAEEARTERLDEFLASVGSTTLERVNIEAVLADLKERGIEPAVLREVEECLEQVK